MKEYANIRPEVTYLDTSSQSTEFRDAYLKHNWDLVLIDGDHSYTGALADYNLVRKHAEYIAFHDIRNIMCPGTQQIWLDMKQKYPSDLLHEWTEQYDEVLLRMRGSIMGIGLVENVQPL